MEPLGQDGSRQVADADGQVLAGRYRLVSLLGQGGMGAVWRAHDEQLDREVAVKELRLPEHLHDAARQTWIARLDREARAAAGLRHPGIVTVHDRVTGDDGRPWIVMELVRGRSLGDLLRAEGRLPPVRVAQIGLRLLDALRAAHQAGITHRDIKPANVLLENDRVVLTDFGIAAVEGDATLTGTGAVLGTPAYMSPEQVRGQEATAAADLWSLGATLYTAVEGRPPFEGASTGAVFIAIATQDPTPPAHAGPLEPILRTLLHRDPSQRPTLDRLHAQLTWLVQGRPPAQPTLLQPSAQPPAPQLPQRPARTRRKKVVLIALVAAATALTLVPTAGWAVTAFRERQGNQRYEANMNTIAGMGTIPGDSSELTRTHENTVEVDSILCEDTSAVGCNLEGQVTIVINWLRSRTGVRSVILKPPTEEPNTYPSRSLLVLTQNSLKITEVLIYDDEHNNKIMLSFTVG
ncbi:serine/threonine-protein kinase [Actinomadura mexicana]|uniref:non-specific serine/threonine protein kinase n=1 Tax=Actinomadura mexicana TaxID=134959 RepID=A0A239AXB8_9ACTN|nr:serine/threonine-protein kinase [Actinomadura mexicana]SNS00001.1 Serine/threonine protein kinase [Actinomadura mexicana]